MWRRTQPQFSQEEIDSAYDHASFNKHFVRLLVVSLLLGILALVLVMVLVKMPGKIPLRNFIAGASGLGIFAMSMVIGSRIVDGTQKRKAVRRLRMMPRE